MTLLLYSKQLHLTAKNESSFEWNLPKKTKRRMSGNMQWTLSGTWKVGRRNGADFTEIKRASALLPASDFSLCTLRSVVQHQPHLQPASPLVVSHSGLFFVST